MELSVVKAQIKNRKVSNFYIFIGEETQVQNIYINKIANVTGSSVVFADSLTEIHSNLFNRSLFDKNSCYVLLDDEDFTTNDKLWDIQSKIKDGVILVLKYTNIDKRSRFYNHFKNIIVEFNRLPENVMIKHIRKEIDLSESSCKRLIGLCESDWGRIVIEVDKIKNYADALKLDDETAFRELLNQKAIYQPPQDAIFDLVDAILRRKLKLSFQLLQECISINENTFAILSVLYNNARQVLQVQTCKGRNIEQSTGLTAWQVKCAKERCNYYADEDLMYLLELIAKIDNGIKNGLIEESVAIPYLIVNLMG